MPVIEIIRRIADKNKEVAQANHVIAGFGYVASVKICKCIPKQWKFKE